MLIITNRNINRDNFINGIGDHNAFGDWVNAKGPNEVRLANAVKKNNQWQVTLIDEPDIISSNNLPSAHALTKLQKKLTTEKKNAVFFVHGFNQSFEKNLEKSLAMEKEHGVEVIAFSWPSNPGGFKTREYRHAKRTARASVGALDATLEKFASYLKVPFNKAALEQCEVKFSLLTYSLGNYLFQHYITDALYENETSIFDNIVLCQADVDNHNHASWVNTIETGKKVYITINEKDSVLKWSDLNFQRNRLGRTAKNLNSPNAMYFDFTAGDGVGRTHDIFYKKTNPVVKEFFTKVLNGEHGEEIQGMRYDSRSNSFRF